MTNIPNILTGFRFAVIPVLAILLMVPQHASVEVAAFGVFVVAAVTDFFDGYLARKLGAETVLGKLLDPLADKVLVITALIMLIPLGKIPAIASLVIISREVIITGLRGLAASSGIIVPAGMLGKIKSTLQYLGVGVLLLPVIITGQYEIGRVLVYISLVMALWSGIDYCYRLREVLFKAAE